MPCISGCLSSRRARHCYCPRKEPAHPKKQDNTSTPQDSNTTSRSRSRGRRMWRKHIESTSGSDVLPEAGPRML
eukprot:7162716-Pyramimonas_sp.AAC.1